MPDNYKLDGALIQCLEADQGVRILFLRGIKTDSVLNIVSSLYIELTLYILAESFKAINAHKLILFAFYIKY